MKYEVKGFIGERSDFAVSSCRDRTLAGPGLPPFRVTSSVRGTCVGGGGGIKMGRLDARSQRQRQNVTRYSLLKTDETIIWPRHHYFIVILRVFFFEKAFHLGSFLSNEDALN